MHIKLNGKAQEFPAGLNIEGLMRTLALSSKQVAIERNGEIVPRSQYASTPVAEGDTVEIVQFIGGG